MPVLALDTSADITVCVVDGAAPDGLRVLARERAAEQRRHAEMLAPMVRAVLARAGVDRRDLTDVVVGTGPAPFTGLRAGLVTARTLGFALGIPVHGVCSLDVLAAQAFDAGLRPDREVVVVTDARRRELYVGRYRRGVAGEVDVVQGPVVLRPADLADQLALERPGDAAVVGPGAGLYPEHLTAADGGPTTLDPAVLARLALLRRAAGAALPTEPLYLRRPDVVPAAGSKRATG